MLPFYLRYRSDRSRFVGEPLAFGPTHRNRFALLLQRSDLEFERERAEYILSHGVQSYEQAVARLDQSRAAQKAELLQFLKA